MRHQLVAALAAASVCLLVVGVALQERAGRSPAAMLASGLYYTPYPAPGPYQYGYYAAGYGGSYPYGGGYAAYDPYYGGGFPYYAYDEDNAYQQYAAQEEYRQWAEYAAQQQYEDAAAQANYYNWAAANSYKQQKKTGSVLKVANSKNTNKLVYLGDLEMGGYRHDITGGNDGGYNAPFDLNGDGQEVDNWAKVTTHWKHKKGKTQLQQRKLDQLHYVNSAEGNAGVDNIFDSLSRSAHGVNNGMLHKRTRHEHKKGKGSDPKLTPAKSLFAGYGNGDVTVKDGARQQRLRQLDSVSGEAAARMQSLQATIENPLNEALDSIPETVSSLDAVNEV